MATITLKINERTKEGKAFLNYLHALSIVQIVEDKTPHRYNSLTEKTISEARKGKDIKRVKNSQELFKDLGI